ncbi:DUF6043 family protein [Lepagella muris]|uniref:Uncharacterized protein n=1 Tax=Lepagella muris TaxID=3032870 RepID=A0AC61RFK1_9BACT|nr:DUF6043 family protein [Lepagella muris]ROT04271.1 hypothetical protein EEL33_14995 [Muribaculaceae bacterium Isolate-037 (Harlan)]TGY78972.1 hypothetical protein E5331_07860 [Lepagella muris]THG52413.1 hypothetical protein E5984_07135 [Bacteroidales bacterium]TKC60745.1 hypothetical protein E5359_007275 [Bacteroidales bacterium]
MKNQQDNLGSQDGKIDLKMWMEEHPQEYGEFAAAMGEADSLEVFLLGAAAFLSSPEFQKRLENMIDLDNLDLDELLKIIRESGYARIVLSGQPADSEWAKYRLPFAAWLKYGRSSEMMIDNIEEAAESIDNKQYQWQLAKFMKTFLAREVEDKRRSRKDLKEYLDYRMSVDNCNLADWALEGIDESKPTAKITENAELSHDLLSLLASHGSEIVKRIGKWIETHIRGVDIAHLYVALVESGELDPSTPVKRFVEILSATFPECKIVGERQVQKSVNTLQDLSPNRKRFIKDEPEHRFAIDSIKTDVLRIDPDGVD